MTCTHTPPCDELLDAVAQSLFGIGLQLEQCIEATEDAALRANLDASVRGLHDVIGRLRERGELHRDTPGSC